MTTVLGLRLRRPVPALLQASALPALGLLIGLGIWGLAVAVLGRSVPILLEFSPQAGFANLASGLASGVLVRHAGASLLRVGVGLVLAVLVAVPLGLLLGLKRRLELTTSAVFQFIRMISPLSWMPIAVMVFGVGDLPVFFLLAIAAIWPILLSITTAVRTVDPLYIQVARSFAAEPLEIVTRIVLPAIRPSLLASLRVAVGLIWLVLVPAEMLGVSSGLGYLILDCRDRLAYGELTAALLVIGLIGWALDALLRRFSFSATAVPQLS
ncbi:ABC transporter permease [Vulcanococcus limneticus]|uniref:ABC transporter permease n=1 Tax=Vulcanococcus limneticus TaxID=2170428 RepID=UPI000B985F94|nr:ABC transporter permease subunit [Vulcanococcus limneticus]MCP9791574.1 ABC transporter permease subunit [Vulcanococcus limneticus MW73D5]MCP9893430.1 ABC transporter permease subunit [Vulcanococcus limneticus Candia 3F8]MCP9897012.1 ABC transporter permease subunit [Vulcanococcus limneticus Candia 3B3]